MKGTFTQPCFLIVIFLAVSGSLLGQQAKVKVHVYPPESQIFVDGRSWGDGSATVKASPGSHSLTVYNYGFTALTREVFLQEGENASLDFNLVRLTDQVSGPWGRIQIEDARDAAVFLNGDTRGYFVGHSDMFNHNVTWMQQLIVPIGTQHVSVTNRDGSPIWSGDVSVEANKRVIIHTASGKITVKNWSKGAQLSPQPRFTAGIASASVVVAPVTAKFAAQPAQINCGDTTQLSWSTQDAVDTSIAANSTNLGDMYVSGERAEQPKQTTEYQFRAVGPGGVTTSVATVDVDTAIQVSFDASPAEVRYHRMGDRVVENTPTKLNWTSTNADSASIEPIGTVNGSGDQAITPAPNQMANGPVDENVTYSFVAKNMCGGSKTQTATVHITGMIEPVPGVPLASVFFPTGYPEQKRPQIGLVRSQHDVLAKTAEGLKKYLIYDPDARVTVTGHADIRDAVQRNQSLSERRANGVKACLVSEGIPSDKIDIVAVGKQQNLDRATVLSLHDQNPQKPEFTKRDSEALAWAYNRRVDIMLLPTGQNSVQYFPGNANDARLILRSDWPSRRSVEKASEVPAGEPNTGAAAVKETLPAQTASAGSATSN